ncbi:hypothetical protein QR680_004357 [Steinernema hermaphroditum]|uniref:RNA-dependent RNA polymerase n=1 Tax=Steinernema hermaphroditum TaxID=289476 RepID=A0AA39LTV2_9BILA|nr:hypothetical protein QR680_004357 [Steinernema hermaphroditum]
MTSRLKIIVETTLYNSPYFQEDAYINKVLKNIHHEFFSLDLSSVSSRPITDDFGFKSVHIQVDARSNNWEWGLPQLAELFCRFSSLFRERHYTPSILEISNDLFFKEYFDPVNEKVPLRSIALGNLVDPFTFYEHHRQENFQVRRKDGMGMIGCMKVAFEHDIQVIKLRFDDKIGYAKPTTVTLTVMYSQIHRIIVDVREGKNRGTRSFSLYLHLCYPVEVRAFDVEKRTSGRCLTWRKGDDRLERIIADCPVLRLDFVPNMDSTIYNILSRLRKRTNVLIEFAPIELQKPHRFSENPLEGATGAIDHSVLYLLEAILSRGAMVKDVLLDDKATWEAFVNFFTERHAAEPEVTIAAMEKILSYVNETREIRKFKHVCETLWERARTEQTTKSKADKEFIDEGYQYVRKVIVTPSRKILLAPELVMGNRGLRDFKEKDEDVIRVQFRDDDGDKLRENRAGRLLIQKTVGETAKKGLTVAGVRYEYFGNSGSQMRDNGCYCFAESVIGKVREKIGVFDKNTSVPKRMSRIGQFFTQARRLKKNIQREQYLHCFDILGGNDQNGKPYTFSDGVGMITPKFAEEISKDLELRGHIPSCFQFRFRGMKGVLAVNPLLADRFKSDFYIRPSQMKFQAYRKKKVGAPLEIVKYSTPCGVSLNRPMLNILDQVSEKQNPLGHERIVARVHELMDQQVNSLILGLTSETHCREKMQEMPIRMQMDVLSHDFGFQLTSEPFFRSLLQALCRCQIKKLRTKNSIAIPPNLGRTVFGIIDESGQLQYGQVFCQITCNGFLKHPTASARKKVITGKVLMTKNPAIVSGDVRVFEAVDIPELHDLVDVVIFPRYGPRPHPDEMAGSDLDGDEYVIIWDERLLLDHNEEPMHFPSSTAKVPEVPEEAILEKACDFFVDYIRNDSVGKLAIAHLAVSDIYGIESKAAKSIALKHAKALDFPKTGDPPDLMNEEEGERPTRFPDFLEKFGQPSCRTPGLNGQIYRQTLDEILRKSMGKALDQPVELDPDLIHPAYEPYRDLARQHFSNYSAQIRTAMEKYGIEDEAQLFSGSIVEIRRRVGDVTIDGDLFGSFNVFANIERLVTGIFLSFRSAFFDRFHVVGEDINKFVCERPSEEMKKLASAYYVTAYETAKENHTERFLSFAWIVWDVLAAIKKAAFFRKSVKEQSDLSLAPFATRISQHMAEYCSANEEDLADFTKVVARSNVVLEHMCYRYVGLNSILFFLCVWAEENDVFHSATEGDVYEQDAENEDFPSASPLRFDSFCLLVVLFGMRKFHCPYVDYRNLWFDNDLSECSRVDLKDLHARFGGVGSLILAFLQFLSSREFASLKAVDFGQLGYRSCVDVEDLKLLHTTASKTYNEMIFSNSCDPLPQTSRQQTSIKERQYEMDPFTIELPRPREGEFFTEAETERFQKKIIKETRVSHLRLRQLKETQRNRTGKCVRIMISAIGSLESLDNLKNLLTGEVPSRSADNLEWCEEHLAPIILKRIEMNADE